MKHTVLVFMKWAFVLILSILGVALLIAGKIGAGAMLICAAAIIILPLGRLIKNARILRWARIVVVAVLCMLAILSVASTDIPLKDETSGYVFIDQISSIAQDVRDKLFGSGEPMQKPPNITKEAAITYTKCMRNHGITDFPEPDFSNGGTSFEGISKLSASVEDIKKAGASCAHILKGSE
ncbi:hypothetical protein [Paenibacillus mendelii]|uniref:Uncharacterized protein n=1 Tax=Paenibacillus mendelii TaxID=206163 RepID=A0ABV6JE00_9BACL|nr:hypothetical protein [Paenibacillus mendelii]MCQ6563398.1 hypothetical protein [Paenibacillus mendelii]